MTVARATPVASFIIVLWLLIGSDSVPLTITALMVTPIVWQNVSDVFGAIDPELDEVCKVYHIRGFKRFKILVAPTLIKYLIPGIITSAGLAWKSGIAAEIIAYTSDSIGREIYNAKAFLESERMLAWTMVVIILSLIFEATLSFIGRRLVNGKSKG
jgi:NitT/TauT family transport system permease protein